MSTQWNGDMSQLDFMHADECIIVDFDDKVIGHESKYKTHVFDEETPRGKIHRAFSVFLFNSEGKLLLQQRASEKITFPNVWTNTCCSHPLFGFTPSEVDDASLGKAGISAGAKAAAVRKLKHELGIESDDVTVSNFKFLTRLHYWAADILTHGDKSPWGENEIDYILFIKANVDCIPNPEEVRDIKYVDLKELQEMMKPSSGLLWSPWFRIIAEQFLVHWWKDLDATLTTDKYVDLDNIHRFDPAPEFMGGKGNAGVWLGKATAIKSAPIKTITGNTALKQGAYGKVKVHKHSKLDQLCRINEVAAALWLVYGSAMPNKVDRIDENVIFCDDMLGKVSRSFAAVIRQLPKGLCLDILIFYLVLRALDTIEDDMEAFKGREEVKIKYLQTFYDVALSEEGWCMDGVGEADEKVLLQQFYRVGIVYRSLPEMSRKVIGDIARRMGCGMAEYVQKDLGQGTVKLPDYYLYCHYVAGLIGEGLSYLFTSTGFESSMVKDVAKTLANTMGLFLQKTNIIRDYLEDYVDGRAFWPQEVWKKYATSGELGEFAKPEAKEQALACLNHLVTDALECVPECLQYMALLHHADIFRFCAIPQVMAIATLAEVYNNHKVFTGVVKIRKGMAAQLILDSNNTTGLHKWFHHFAKDILSRIPPKDPSATATKRICEKIIQLTSDYARTAAVESFASSLAWLAPVAIASGVYHLTTNPTIHWSGVVPSGFSTATDGLALASIVAGALFVTGYQVLGWLFKRFDM